MKKIVLIISYFLLSAMVSCAQNSEKNAVANSIADNILGKYLVVEGKDTTHVEVFKSANGSYLCKNYGSQPEYDRNGRLILDTNSQSPEYRKVPIHEAVIIFGLVYDSEQKIWTGGKIHNPYNRLMKANCDAYFVADGNTLCVFGNFFGVGAKRFWQKIQ